MPFVTPSDMNGARIISTTVRCLSSSGQTAVRNAVIPKNAVMVSCIGSDMGKAAIAGAECVTNQQINSIIVDAENLPLFVYYNLSLRKVEIRGSASGSAQPILNKSAFGRLEIELPPLEEQRAISETLGALDDRIANLRQTNATLQAVAAALFKSYFVDFDGALPEDMQESELGQIPKGWRVGAVGDLAEIKGGKQLEKEHFDEEGANPIFGGAGEMGRTDLSNADGFVITVGRVGAYCGQFFWHLGSAWVNNNASRIVVGDNAGFWLYWRLRHLDIDKIKKGAAQPFVSNSDLAAMHIVIPDDEAIASFNSLAADLHKQMARIDQQAATLATLRDTLLPRLISGRLRVHTVGVE